MNKISEINSAILKFEEPSDVRSQRQILSRSKSAEGRLESLKTIKSGPGGLSSSPRKVGNPATFLESVSGGETDLWQRTVNTDGSSVSSTGARARPGKESLDEPRNSIDEELTPHFGVRSSDVTIEVLGNESDGGGDGNNSLFRNANASWYPNSNYVDPRIYLQDELANVSAESSQDDQKQSNVQQRDNMQLEMSQVPMQDVPLQRDRSVRLDVSEDHVQQQGHAQQDGRARLEMSQDHVQRQDHVQQDGSVRLDVSEDHVQRGQVQQDGRAPPAQQQGKRSFKENAIRAGKLTLTVLFFPIWAPVYVCIKGGDKIEEILRDREAQAFFRRVRAVAEETRDHHPDGYVDDTISLGSILDPDLPEN